MIQTLMYAFLMFPMTLYALGLGAMKVESALDQPFKAEIELIDIHSAPLSNIKVGLGDPESFDNIGLTRAPVLDLLQFKIEKNQEGRWVIRIKSQERISEPYLELVVDLAWTKGQLYKAYTVLLDPPGYQLTSSRIEGGHTYRKHITSYSNEPGVRDKAVVSSVSRNSVVLHDSKNKASYGPTLANENVWQIAQHYKTSEVTLPEIVLAIVGANPEAFKDGNLNGLKVGAHLTIPATKAIQQIAADFATEEVMAHDNAWNAKTGISHVLTPPYMGTPLPHDNGGFQESKIPSVPQFSTQDMPITQVMPQILEPALFVAPVNQTNEGDMLTKAQLSITTAALESLRESTGILVEQLHAAQDNNKQLQRQLDQNKDEMNRMRSKIRVLIKERKAIVAQPHSMDPVPHSQSTWPYALLLLIAAGALTSAYWFVRGQVPHKEEDTIPAVEPQPVIATAAPKMPQPRSLKSVKAFDTLLSLVKTYIGMNDFDSARRALEEVLEHGSKAQKAIAKTLLEEIKTK
ncbi:MAG: FimV/HubP family polar landmark protein [Legionellales bacterium]